jgi:FkbM family methyltransferase
VLSFEPSPNSLPYLQRTRAEADVADRWDVLGKAAGSESGLVRFSVASPRYSVLDGLQDTQRAAGLSHAIEVPMTTVDVEWRRLGSPAVSCIKVDVEGAETQVLAGSEALIAQERPRIVLEWNRENLAAHRVSTDELLKYANERDYDVLAFPGLSPVTGPSLLEIHMLRTEMFLLAPKS